MSQHNYTDIRLIPITAEHISMLTSEDANQIVKAVRFVLQAYDRSPPLTIDQAMVYTHDVEWWRREISDL